MAEGHPLKAMLEDAAAAAFDESEKLGAGIGMVRRNQKELTRIEGTAEAETVEALKKQIVKEASFIAYCNDGEISRHHAEITLSIEPENNTALASLVKYYAESEPERALDIAYGMIPNKEGLSDYLRAQMTAIRIVRASYPESTGVSFMLRAMHASPDIANMWPDMEGYISSSGSDPREILAKHDRAIAAEPTKFQHMWVKGLYMALTEADIQARLDNNPPQDERYREKLEADLAAMRGGADVVENALALNTSREAFTTAASAAFNSRAPERAIAILERGLITCGEEDEEILGGLSLLWRHMAEDSKKLGHVEKATEFFQRAEEADTRIQRLMAGTTQPL